MSVVRYSGKLIEMPRGGHAIELTEVVAAKLGAKHGTRVKGTFDGVEFRSNLASMGERLVLGVHKATVEAARVDIGDSVKLVMELDNAPGPTDAVPSDLGAALRKNKLAAAVWDKLAPSHKREYIGAIMEAKKEETRARRIAKAIEELSKG